MLYRMGILIALIAGPAFGQFGSGDYHGARWDPILRCWVFPDGKNTAGVPWNQRLLGGDATGDSAPDIGTGGKEGPKVDLFGSKGPPFKELYKSVKDITEQGQVDRVIKDVMRQAEDDAAAVRARLEPSGDMFDIFTATGKSGDALDKYRRLESAVFSLDVKTAKSRNAVFYGDASSLQPVDYLPGVAPGQAFTNRAFQYLALPQFPEGFDVPPQPPTTGVNPFPPLPPDVLRRLEEARKKLAAKKQEEALANLPQVVVAQEELLDALREVGDVMDRTDPRRRVVGAEMIVVGDSIVLQTVGGQIIAPYDPPVTGGTAGFSTGPRKLSDGTLHYPYVPGLPVTDNFLRPDGGLVSLYGDGSKEFTDADGTRVLRTRDGYKRVVGKDGTVTWFDPQGRLVQMEDRISAMQQVLWAVLAQSYIKEINAQYDTEIPLAGIAQLYSNNGAFFPDED